MKRLLIFVMALAMVCASQAAAARRSVAGSKGESQMSVRQKGRVRAPELEGHKGWLNTDRPLTLAGLRGKVVLLDFWTYGCVNCMHIIPDLKRLEAKYANQLVVVGVHSAKFENEKETENIRRIILRYGIEHPVVNDADFKIWNAYAVRAWPTRVLIDPAGYVVGTLEGEGNYEGLERAIGELAEEARARGELNEQPLALALERAKTGDLPLAFPGKILADAKSDRLYVSDTNHNRIVVARLDGTVVETIGTGTAGADDGPLDRATFNHPQGLTLDRDTLYVADTQNHLVRYVDLKERRVGTAAGTGQQARGRVGGADPAIDVPLSSPWDVQVVKDGAYVKGGIYIAMAGSHQIWVYALGGVGPYAGSGREARRDGPHEEAAFAQPSGLATDGKTLYVADSESNIVREVEVKEDGSVKTLVGGDLFEFGDEDGVGDDVRLQHPLGLAYDGGVLYVADTYNHKIKRLDPRTQRVTTFVGTGRPGQADGKQPSFYEPGGLSVANGKLYVADTNNHAVRVVDLKTRETKTLAMRGLRPPASNAPAEGESASAGPNATELTVAPQRLVANAAAILNLDVALPAGYHLNPSAPHRLKLNVESGKEFLALGSLEGIPTFGPGVGQPEISMTAKSLKLPLVFTLLGRSPGESVLRARLTLYYCREDDTGVCRVKTLAWRVPVEVSADAGAAREIKLQAKVEISSPTVREGGEECGMRNDE